jgi:hypothetical protein
MGAGGDQVTNLQNRLGAIQAVGEIPVLGTMVRIVDNLLGASDKLRQRITSVQFSEASTVRMAHATKSPSEAASADAEKFLRDTIRAQFAGVNPNNYNPRGNLLEGKLSSEQWKAWQDALKEAEQMKAAGLREEGGQYLTRQSQLAGARLRLARRPEEAALTERLGGIAAAARRAHPYIRQEADQIADLQTQAERQQYRLEEQNAIAGYNARANIGDVLSKSGGGMTMLAGSLSRIESLQSEMRMASRDPARFTAAQRAYGSELRAMEAGLLPRGGGYAATASPGTQIIGDPAGIEITARDREFALQAVRAARAGAGDTSPD